jgi:cytochrome c oxidase subunit 2
VSTLAAATAALDPATQAAIDSGAKLFRSCSACHSLDATTTANLIGPNLANIGSRRYIGARTLLNTDENLAKWIYDPQVIKHGILMPKLGLTHEQAVMVAQYLRTHR